jgi:Fe2+ transport system protein FeoA
MWGRQLVPASRPPSPATKRDSGTHVGMWCRWCQAPHGRGAAETIARLGERDAGLLEWLYEQGLVPGAKVEVASASAPSGEIVVRLGARERTIGTQAAQEVFVHPARLQARGRGR